MRMLVAADFLAATAPAPLPADAIHLWYFRSDRKAEHANVVESLLAGYLEVPRESVFLARDAHAKPYIASPAAADLHFNVSHSGSSLIVALARKLELGVDIEESVRARPWLALAERYFAPAEVAALARRPPAERGYAFVEMWNCKEAVLKALGRGIAFGLHRLVFQTDERGEMVRLVSIAAEAGAVGEWRVVRFATASGASGALAWRGTDRRVQAFTSTGAGFAHET